MPYEIVTNEEDSMVVVCVYGKSSEEYPAILRDRAAAVCARSGFKRLLIDLSELDTKGTTTSEDRGESGRHAAGDKRLEGVAIANVLPKDFESCLEIKSIGAVAASVGKEIGEFATFAEAREWLMS